MNQLIMRDRMFSILGAQSLPLVMSVLIAFALFTVPQLRDLIWHTNEGAGPLIMYIISLVYYCLIMWFTCRWTLNQIYTGYDVGSKVKPNTPEVDWLIIWTPRIIPLVFLTIILIYSVIKGFSSIAWSTVVVATIMLTFFWCRREWYKNASTENITAKPIVWLSIFFTVYAVSTYLALFEVALFAELMGGLAIVLWGFGSIVFGGTLVVYKVLIKLYNGLLYVLSLLLYAAIRFFQNTLKRKETNLFQNKSLLVLQKPYPVTTLLLVTALIVPILPFVQSDNHEYRSVDLNANNSSDRAYGRRFTSLEKAFETFAKNAEKHVVELKRGDRKANKIVPMYFVVNQGGGLRASYWSNSHLALMTDSIEQFNNNVFMMSGASGGTVGNIIHVASVKQSKSSNLTMQEASKRILAGDFLSPVVTSFLFNDFLYRFLPVSFLSDDRAYYLEQSFVEQFSAVYKVNAAANPLNQGYQSFYNELSKDSWLPIVAGTTTIQELGQLAVVYPYPFSREQYPKVYDLPLLERWHFEHERLQSMCENKRNANEQASCEELKEWRHKPEISTESLRDTSLITTAINSARFPYVTPKGSLFKDVYWENKLHTADAGYTDNYGSLPLHRTLAALEERLIKEKESGTVYLPILLIFKNSADYRPLYSSDDSEHDLPTFMSGSQIKAPACHSSFAFNEITGPIQALSSVREGHADENLISLLSYHKTLSQSLLADVESDSDQAFPIHDLNTNALQLLFLYRSDGDCQGDDQDPPLGWWLSKNSQNKMDKQARENIKGMQSLDWLLKRAN